MKAALVFFAAITLARGASDCPTPPKLTCAQLQAKIKERCPAKETAVTVAAVPCTPQYIKEPCDCTPPVPPNKHVETTPKEHGSWLLGGGYIYQNGSGVQGVVGYDWGKVQLLVGPNWVPHSAQTVYAGCNDSLTRHDSNGNPGGGGCVPVAYQAQAPSSLGIAALAVFRLP